MDAESSKVTGAGRSVSSLAPLPACRSSYKSSSCEPLPAQSRVGS